MIRRNPCTIRRLKALFFACSLFQMGGTYGQDLRFERINSSDGLSQSLVTTIIQDRTGYLWMGTQDGLNRYDGYEFKVFKNRPGDLSSLPSNYVLSMLETRDGQLWVGLVSGGVAKFVPSDQSFIRYGPYSPDPKGLTSSTVPLLFQDQHGTVWAGDFNKGLFRYDPEADLFTPIENFAPVSPRTMIDLPNGKLLLGGGDGLLLLDPRDNSVTTANFFPDAIPVGQLFLDDQHRFWIGTTGQGVAVHDAMAEQTTWLKHDAANPRSLSDNDIRGIVQDENGEIWIGTRDGLNRAEMSDTPPASMSWKHYKHEPSDLFGLSNNHITTLFKDRTGILWIGVLGKGLNKLTPISASFGLHKPYNKRVPRGGVVFSMLEASNGDLWVGSYGGGLNFTEAISGETRAFRGGPNDPSSLPGKTVNALAEDSEGHIWAGTESGHVVRWDAKAAAFVSYLEPPNNPSETARVNALLADEKGAVWALRDRSLFHYTPAIGRFVRIPVPAWENRLDLSLKSFRKSAEGGLWFASNINLWHWRDGEIRQLKVSDFQGDALPTASFNSIFPESPNRIWIGSDSGLICMDRPQESSPLIKVYTEEDGLSSNTILGILPDQEGCLWISTSSGLCHFDPVSEQFEVFDAACGLQDNEFNQGSYHLAPSGKLYFGGVNGYNAFYPSNVERMINPPELALTNLLKFNEPAEFAVSPERLTELRLEPQDSVITFQFAAFEFVNPKQTRYAYKLEGFDNQWQYTIGKREATYTNLDPGDYTFLVKAASQGSNWSETGIRLPVKVVPPIWKTKMAYFIYFLAIVALVMMVHYLRVRALDQRQQLLKAQVEEKTRELTLKNVQLEEKNDLLQDRNLELATLDETVKAINREVSMEKLAAALLEEGMRLCPAASRGGLLILDQADGIYRVAASKNHDPAVVARLKLPASTAESRYGKAAEAVARDIFLVRNRPPIPEIGEKAAGPRHMLTVAVRYEGRTAGFLVLENDDDADSLATHALKLEHFREHATSAVSKARNIEALMETARRLQDTRGELLDAAHLAGMAEIATTVLHNVGNTLNSAKVSSQMLHEHLNSSQSRRVFERLIGMLRDNRDNLDSFIRDHTKGQKIPEAFLTVGELILENLEDMRTEANRLDRCIETIQDVVAAQSMHTEKGALLVELDLNLLLEHMLTVNADTFERHRIEVTTHFGNLPVVKVDKAKLVYIITNLLNNACDALSDNKNGRRIVVRTETMDLDFVKVEVADNGIGIDRQYLDRLFKMGFTTKRKGHGFGLHYCANTIKRMGGGISVESPGLGKGAKSILWFPHRQSKEKRVSA